jgi:hypothetical protein
MSRFGRVDFAKLAVHRLEPVQSPSPEGFRPLAQCAHVR